MIKNLAFGVLVALFISACSTKNGVIPRNSEILELEFTQTSEILPHTKEILQTNSDEFLDKFFKVWDHKKPYAKLDEAFWGLNYAKDKRTYYDRDYNAYDESFFSYLIYNANVASYGLLSLPAITTNNTFIRNLPTDEPIFLDPKRPGEGVPFDYLANSTLGVGYPLYLSHYSKDKKWAFAANDVVWGWVKSSDIKILTNLEANEYRNKKFIAILSDKSPILNTKGEEILNARLGTILPFDSEDGEYYLGEFISQNGTKRYRIHKNLAEPWPAKLNDKNIRTIVASILAEPYGWGGYDYNRDCSLMTKDLLSTFGIWLPRNSKAQSNMNGKVSLAGLSNDEKLSKIREIGVPYMSIIYMPGHIMLYTGVINDKVSVLHNVWGLKTDNNGRAIIGKTAITSLLIGKDRGDISSQNLLISKINAITILNRADFDAYLMEKFSKLQTLPNNNIKFASLNPKITKARILKESYGVTLADNKIIFSDESVMEFDDKIEKSYSQKIENADIEDMISGDYEKFREISAPKSDIGRARNEEFLKKIYGENENEVTKNLTDVIWLKNHINKKIKFNAKNGAAKALQNASDKLDELVTQNPQMLKYLQNIGGTFKWRKIAGTNRLSSHSFATAIDINVGLSHYHLWNKKFENKIPFEIVKIFEENGFIWGGRWVSFDTMHFEYRPEFFIY